MINSEFCWPLFAMTLAIGDPYLIAYWVAGAVHRVRAARPYRRQANAGADVHT